MSYTQPNIKKQEEISGSILALGKGVTEKFILGVVYKLADLVGVDTRNKTTASIIQELKETINKPETKKIIADMGEILMSVYETAKPNIDKMIDQSELMAKDIGKRVIVVGQELISEVPIIGPIIELPIIASNIIRTGQKVIESGTNITGIGAETLEQMKRTYDEKRAELFHQLEQTTKEKEQSLSRAETSYGQFLGGGSHMKKGDNSVSKLTTRRQLGRQKRTRKRKARKHFS